MRAVVARARPVRLVIPREGRVVRLDLARVVVLVLRELIAAGEEQSARKALVDACRNAAEVAVPGIARGEQRRSERGIGQPLRLRRGPLARLVQVEALVLVPALTAGICQFDDVLAA